MGTHMRYVEGVASWRSTLTKNDHFETQKCHFRAFLASFKISFSSLQHPNYKKVMAENFNYGSNQRGRLGVNV